MEGNTAGSRSVCTGDGGHGHWQPLLLFVDLYAALLVAYLLLRSVGAGQFWIMEIVSAFLHWLLLFSVFLLFLVVFIRRWRSVILLSITAAAFVWHFGGLFLPPSIGGDPCGEESTAALRVMTYNISNGQANPEILAEVIRHSGADVVALQELPTGQVPILDDGLAENYPYRIFHGEGFSGIGLLSRYPLQEEEVFMLEGPRPYLRADVVVNGQRIHVISAHPPVVIGPVFGDVPGKRDMRTLARLAVSERKTILMGDFNFTDRHVHYQHLTGAGLVDAHRAAGQGFGLTFPRRNRGEGLMFPYVRIDYIFISDGFCPQRAWVGKDGGSDHLPVLADLSW